MNVILLGKIEDRRLCVVERRNYDDDYHTIKYGDWQGFGEIDWWHFGGMEFDAFHVADDFQLIDYPLVPAAYEGKYVLVCVVNSYEVSQLERLVPVVPPNGKMIRETIAEMWGEQ